MTIEVVHVRAYFEPAGLGQGRRVDTRTGDYDHAKFWHELLCRWEGFDHPAQEMAADAGAADRDDADLLARAIPELCP